MNDAETIHRRASKTLAQAYVNLMAGTLSRVGDLPERDVGEALLEHTVEKLAVAESAKVTARRLRTLAAQIEGLN